MVTCNSKKLLLNYFAIIMQTLNPDIVIGHNIIKKELPKVLEDMDANYQYLMSKLNSSDVKESVNVSSQYRVHKLFKGRLICDTFILANECLKEPDNRWDMVVCLIRRLKTLLKKHLNIDQRDDMIPSLLSVLLCLKLRFLSLTQQISRISGCLWQTSLKFLKAEAVEMLISHDLWKTNCTSRMI